MTTDTSIIVLREEPSAGRIVWRVCADEHAVDGAGLRHRMPGRGPAGSVAFEAADERAVRERAAQLLLAGVHATIDARESGAARRPWVAQLGLGGHLVDVGRYDNQAAALEAARAAWARRVAGVDPRPPPPAVLHPRTGQTGWEALAELREAEAGLGLMHRALTAIRRRPGASFPELARDLGAQRDALTKALSRLVEHGEVYRTGGGGRRAEDLYRYHPRRRVVIELDEEAWRDLEWRAAGLGQAAEQLAAAWLLQLLGREPA